MAVLVSDTGFRMDDWAWGYVPLAALADQPCRQEPAGVDLSSPALSRHDWDRLCRLLPQLSLVRVRLRHFGDTAALDLAREIRARGYVGRLRAHGAVLARLYTLLRRSGFDEVELDRDQARMQPAEHWRYERGWQPPASWKPAPGPGGVAPRG